MENEDFDIRWMAAEALINIGKKSIKPFLESAVSSKKSIFLLEGVHHVLKDLQFKPAPDIFLHAAKELKTEPSHCAIFEDAIAGVQAGSSGNFKYVVGVARHGKGEKLYENGANLVIHSFDELN